MNTRRKFLLQGSMATTALLAAKPFDTFAKITAPVTGFISNDNQVTFLHTAGSGKTDHQQLLRNISHVKGKNYNVVLLDAGKAATSQPIGYDASISQQNAITDSDYRIVFKGKVKIGVITATTADADVINSSNTLAQYLKTQRNCDIVVCLSQLGYKNKHAADDMKLAASSDAIDLIIGGNAQNFSKHPVIALNKDNSEVIINHAANSELALGEIAIAFDNARRKRSVAFNTTCDAMMKAS